MINRKSQQAGGFTIVELLIVVVVIAILAAITIVSYNGVQQRTTTAALQSDLRNAINKIEAYRSINGTYPANNDATMATVGLSASKNLYETSSSNFLYCGSASTSRAAVVVLSKNGKTYAMATNRPFGEYTTNVISDYSAVCNDLVGSNAPRYGFVTTSEQWRWVNG